MRYRIAIWAGAGFLVAILWAIYAIATHPDPFTPAAWTLATLTCPISFAGRYWPIRLYWVAAANAATYALAGLIVEALRQKLSHPKWVKSY